jgi:hypothetical protein
MLLVDHASQHGAHRQRPTRLGTDTAGPLEQRGCLLNQIVSNRTRQDIRPLQDFERVRANLTGA